MSSVPSHIRVAKTTIYATAVVVVVYLEPILLQFGLAFRVFISLDWLLHQGKKVHYALLSSGCKEAQCSLLFKKI